MENKDNILHHFEKISNTFDGVYERAQSHILDKLIDILFRRDILEKRRQIFLAACGNIANKEILDIGCGPGRYAILFAEKIPKSVLGVDISNSMIKLAQEKIKNCGLDNICKFEIADFLDKDFQNGFDIIIAAGIFDYIRQPESFLFKIHKLLREKAILSFPIKWTLMTPLRAVWLSKKKCPNFYYTRIQIERLLIKCGFKVISIYRIGSFFVPGNYIAVCSRV